MSERECNCSTTGGQRTNHGPVPCPVHDPARPVGSDTRDALREELMRWLSAKVGGMCFEEAPWQEWGAEADELLALPAVRAALDAQEKLRPCPTCVREGGPYRCCPHCADDPGAHEDGQRNHHDLPCTICLRDLMAGRS